MNIDFHSHMLPGIDDGSPDVETSLEMLRMATEQKTEIQVLTPHYYRWKENIDTFIKRRTESFWKLTSEYKQSFPKLLVGSETAFFQNMSSRDLSPLCIGRTRTLLLEMPFDSWDNRIIEEIAALSLDCNYNIVLAHIERFYKYHGNAEMLDRLSELPIYMQTNAEAFLGFLSRAQALKFVESGRVTILGSDSHNLTNRRPNLGPARAIIEKKLGKSALDRIDRTAEKLLDGELSDE